MSLGTLTRLCRPIDVSGAIGRAARAGLLLAAALGSGSALAALPTLCGMQLKIVLTPGVPDPRNEGFLSSLLTNESGYQLSFVRQVDDSTVVVDLLGPGPDLRCREVVDVIRKDSRVQSVTAQPQTP
jgi:hypothetical protein